MFNIVYATMFNQVYVAYNSISRRLFIFAILERRFRKISLQQVLQMTLYFSFSYLISKYRESERDTLLICTKHKHCSR